MFLIIFSKSHDFGFKFLKWKKKRCGITAVEERLQCGRTQEGKAEFVEAERLDLITQSDQVPTGILRVIKAYILLLILFQKALIFQYHLSSKPSSIHSLPLPLFISFHSGSQNSPRDVLFSDEIFNVHNMLRKAETKDTFEWRQKSQYFLFSVSTLSKSLLF